MLEARTHAPHCSHARRADARTRIAE
jgi:hypothetical protein